MRDQGINANRLFQKYLPPKLVGDVGGDMARQEQKWDIAFDQPPRDRETQLSIQPDIQKRAVEFRNLDERERVFDSPNLSRNTETGVDQHMLQKVGDKPFILDDEYPPHRRP
jgi:hypothetical protein